MARAGHDFRTPTATHTTGVAPHLPSTPRVSGHHFPCSRWLSPPSTSGSNHPCSSCSTPLPSATLAKQLTPALQHPLPASAMQADIPAPALQLEVSCFLTASLLGCPSSLMRKAWAQCIPCFMGLAAGYGAAADAGGCCIPDSLCWSNIMQRQKMSNGSEAWCLWHPWVGRKSHFASSLFLENFLNVKCM